MAGNKEYRRLPGRRWLTFGFSRGGLWLGVDHLLLILNRGYSEEYRRFYYTDIQAIQIRQTMTGTVLNWVLGIVSVLSLLAVLGTKRSRWDTFDMIFWGILGGIMLFVFLVNLIKGPTCICHLRTAVQTEMLPPLHRIRVAKKALAQLRSAVEAAQGVLSTEQMNALIQAVSPSLLQAKQE